ncbi:hypothetical protein SAMN02745165_03569 [Malonomonas rubra DSM 5091]|uniref:Uncharacterized protein n=1 Tax=Malonomonas rubra DSM 5091 TaxID=1122189 RepID=A0A1M6NBJ7_MALRU|nr:hypothetical protein [Malonomonas rubra]SHJ93110.1 hypothetical protein SAMN02745165_03569 [Malonomonas rubra DSM 5091]
MKRFRVKLSAKNILLNFDGEHGKFTFTATRMIRAKHAEAAKRIALIQIHHEMNQNLSLVKGTRDAPKVEIDSIEELKFFQFMSKKVCSGFEFFSEDQTES